MKPHKRKIWFWYYSRIFSAKFSHRATERLLCCWTIFIFFCRRSGMRIDKVNHDVYCLLGRVHRYSGFSTAIKANLFVIGAWYQMGNFETMMFKLKENPTLDDFEAFPLQQHSSLKFIPDNNIFHPFASTKNFHIMFLIISHFNHLEEAFSRKFASVVSALYDDKKLWGGVPRRSRCDGARQRSRGL